MMYWYGNGVTGWGYVLMSGVMVVVWVIVITGIALLVRHLMGRRQTTPPLSPQEILAQRYARGELDEVEYRHRLDTLRTGPHAPTT